MLEILFIMEIALFWYVALLVWYILTHASEEFIASIIGAKSKVKGL
jgi:hypothetical protein